MHDWIVVQNNPVNFVDPLGLVAWDKVAQGAAIFIGGAAITATSTLIIGVGAFELSHGNVLGIHAISQGAIMWGTGVFIGSKGWEQVMVGWNEEPANPCK